MMKKRIYYSAYGDVEFDVDRIIALAPSLCSIFGYWEKQNLKRWLKFGGSIRDVKKRISNACS